MSYIFFLFFVVPNHKIYRKFTRVVQLYIYLYKIFIWSHRLSIFFTTLLSYLLPFPLYIYTHIYWYVYYYYCLIIYIKFNYYDLLPKVPKCVYILRTKKVILWANHWTETWQRKTFDIQCKWISPVVLIIFLHIIFLDPESSLGSCICT